MHGELEQLCNSLIIVFWQTEEYLYQLDGLPCQDVSVLFVGRGLENLEVDGMVGMLGETEHIRISQGGGDPG